MATDKTHPDSDLDSSAGQMQLGGLDASPGTVRLADESAKKLFSHGAKKIGAAAAAIKPLKCRRPHLNPQIASYGRTFAFSLIGALGRRASPGSITKVNSSLKLPSSTFR